MRRIIFDGCGTLVKSFQHHQLSILYGISCYIYTIKCIFKRFSRHCPAFCLRANQTASVHIPAVEVTSLKLFNHRNITGICGGQITLSQVESNCDFTYSPLFPSCHAPLLLIYNLPPLPLLGPALS